MLTSKSPWTFSYQYETFYWKERLGSTRHTHLSDKSPCALPPGHSAESGWTVPAHRWRQRGCHGLAGVGPQAALCLPRLRCWNPIHGPVLWPKVRPSLVWTRVLGNTYLQLNCAFVVVLIVIFCGLQIPVIILRVLCWQKCFFFNMLYLGQIIFFRISALWGVKRDTRNLSLADFQDRLSYWFAPMYSVGHMEVEGYVCAFISLLSLRRWITFLIPDFCVKNRTVGIGAQEGSLHTSIYLPKQSVILSSRTVILSIYSMILSEQSSYWRWPVKIFTAVSHCAFQCSCTRQYFSAFITKILFVYKMDVSHFICTPLAFRLGFYLLWCIY